MKLDEISDFWRHFLLFMDVCPRKRHGKKHLNTSLENRLFCSFLFLPIVFHIASLFFKRKQIWKHIRIYISCLCEWHCFSFYVISEYSSFTDLCFFLSLFKSSNRRKFVWKWYAIIFQDFKMQSTWPPSWKAKYKTLKKIYREKSTPIYFFQTFKNQKIRVKEYKAIAKSRMPDGLNNNWAYMTEIYFEK